MHRDIKPENILIDVKGKVIIGDFGFAVEELLEQDLNQLKKSQNLISKNCNVGTEEYNAPELFEPSKGEYDGAKADIFSLAVVLFMMLTKCPPFRSAQPKDPYFRRLSAHDKSNYWKIF